MGEGDKASALFAAAVGLDILGSMLGLNACDRFSSSGD
jgi:hypothetical protein